MPLFVIHSIDRLDAGDLRARWREDHVAHVRGSGLTRIAGPILGEDDAVAGSLMVIETTDLAAAQAFAADDPFSKAGLFASVDVRPFRLTVLDLKDCAP